MEETRPFDGLRPARIGIYASRSGTNAEAIMKACQAGEINGDVVVLFTDKPETSGAPKRAEKFHVSVESLSWIEFLNENFPDLGSKNFRKLEEPEKEWIREAYEEKIEEKLAPFRLDVRVLAGYMKILSQKFCREHLWQIINIHPAITPAFLGSEHAQRDAIEYGSRVTGASTHFITPGPIDEGPVILQGAIWVRQDDTEKMLSKRMLEHVEWPLYVRTLKYYCEGRISVRGRKVIINGEEPPIFYIGD